MNRSREDVWLEGVEKDEDDVQRREMFLSSNMSQQQSPSALSFSCLPLAGDHRTYENPPALFALFAVFYTSGIKIRHPQAQYD